MQETIQKHATGEAAEDSDSEHMKKVLRVEHARVTTIDERMNMRRKFRDEIRKANPLVSNDELKSLLGEAMLGAALEWRRKEVQSAKDSLSLLPLGTVKKADALSSCAEPKTNIPLGMMKILSLTSDERIQVYAATRDAYPDTKEDAFSLKYKIALWEADVKKKGGNPGRHLGNVDLSSLDDTDDEEDSAEDSNSSDDGMRAIRDDLEKQRKVSSPSSPKENRFLAGLMRSSDKQPLDALAKQALDKDPISLFSPLDQAEDEAMAMKRGQRAGDVQGHGSSMSVQHGFSSLDPPEDALAADLRSAAAVIKMALFSLLLKPLLQKGITLLLPHRLMEEEEPS
jgi:hypothetical protein